MTTNIVTLAQVHAHLRLPTAYTADDGILQILMNAADVVLEYECDDILPTAYSERHDGGQFRIYTRHRPVIEVRNVEENWGFIKFELDFQDASTDPTVTTMFGYALDSPETGEISRRSVASVPIPFIPGEKNIFIQYVAGYEPQNLPGNLILAELELISHWYQNALVRGVSLSGSNLAYDATQGTVYSRDTESGTQNINIGVPYRILELIKPHRRMPVIG